MILGVGSDNFYTDAESFAKYGSDETEKLHYLPQLVVKPRKAEEIAQLLNISLRGVEISRYRLRKKLDLLPEQTLVEFLNQIN